MEQRLRIGRQMPAIRAQGRMGLKGNEPRWPDHVHCAGATILSHRSVCAETTILGRPPALF